MEALSDRFAAQAELRRLLDAGAADGQVVVFAASGPPEGLAGFEEPLLSRLRSARHFRLAPCSPEWARGVLRRRLAEAGRVVSDDLLDYVSRRVGTLRELEAAAEDLCSD